MLDKETLQLLSQWQQPKVQPGSRSMLFCEDAASGRFVKDTPLITDGHLVHMLVSDRGYCHSETFSETSNHRVVVETYDARDGFRFLRATTLRKRNNRFLGVFADKAFKRPWATNGSVLTLYTTQKTYFFDLETGMKIGTCKLPNLPSELLCYSHADGLFYELEQGPDKRIRAFDFTGMRKRTCLAAERSPLASHIAKRRSILISAE